MTKVREKDGTTKYHVIKRVRHTAFVTFSVLRIISPFHWIYLPYTIFMIHPYSEGQVSSEGFVTQGFPENSRRRMDLVPIL